MMVENKSELTTFGRFVSLLIAVVVAVGLLGTKADVHAADLVNTSNAQATPYLCPDAYIPATSSLKAQNIVSSDSNLPTKLYYGKSFPGFGGRSSQTALAPFIFYSSNGNYDKSARVNPKKLTQAQTLELARYGLNLINQYRRLYGRRPLKITYKMVKLEEQYIAYRTKKNIDRHALDEYDKQYTNYINRGKLNGRYLTLSWADSENLSYDYTAFRPYAKTNSDATTMLQLKVSIYNGISQMMFCDGGANNWGHRSNFMEAKATEIAFGVQYRYKRTDTRLLNFVWNMGTINDGSADLTNSGTTTAVDAAERKHNELKSNRNCYIKKVQRLDLTKSAKNYYIKQINKNTNYNKIKRIYDGANKASRRYFNSEKNKTLRTINRLRFKRNKKAKAYYNKKAKSAKSTSQLASVLRAARRAAR